MNYANRIKPEIQGKILAEVAEKLKNFDPTSPEESNWFYDSNKGVSAFYFSKELNRSDWRTFEVYDPDGWNDIQSVEPPCRGVYRVNLNFSGGLVGMSEILAYWDGKKWKLGVEGADLPLDELDGEGAFRDIELEYLE